MKSLEKGELIGLNIEIINSNNKANIGIKGKLIDETRHMLIIKNKSGLKKVIKEQNIFAIKQEEKIETINGKKLVGTGEERIKK